MLQLKHLFRKAIQPFPVPGENHILGGPDKQPAAKLRLQTLDMGADGGLGQIEFFACFGKTSGLRHADEGFQLF